jgi:hypothetical protein
MKIKKIEKIKKIKIKIKKLKRKITYFGSVLTKYHFQPSQEVRAGHSRGHIYKKINKSIVNM